MTSTTYNGFLFTSVVVVLITILIHATEGQQQFFVCDGEAVSQDQVQSISSCYRLGDYPRNRTEADRYCRRRGGTLSGSLLRFKESLSRYGITSLWSNLTIRNGRLVLDTPASPDKVTSEIRGQFNTAEPFYVPDGSCVRFDECPAGFPCESPYIMNFGSCADQLNFLCEIPATRLSGLERQSDDTNYFTIDDLPDVNFQFSQSSTDIEGADDVCSREMGGQAFRLYSDADKAILNVLTANIGEYLNTIDVPEPEVFTTLFWVDTNDRRGCKALSLVDWSQSFSTFPLIQTWPCDAKLRVLCQWDRVYEDQTAPEMEVDTYSQSRLIRRIGNDILAHSDIIRQVGGLIPLVTAGEVDLEIPGTETGEPALDIYCSVPFVNRGQSATIYANNGVVKREVYFG
ncbi:hypothetical protein EGW08_012607, partial [Elysia chlorotica]